MEEMPRKSAAELEAECLRLLAMDPHTRGIKRVEIIRMYPKGTGPNWTYGALDPMPTPKRLSRRSMEDGRWQINALMQSSLVGGRINHHMLVSPPSEDHSHGCCWRRLRPFRCGVRRQNRKVPGNGDCPSEQRAYEQKGRRLCTAHRYLCKAPSRDRTSRSREVAAGGAL